MEAFVNTGKRGFPRDADGDLAAMIHPQLQGRDFQPLRRGDPIFLSHSLDVTRFCDDVNAAAAAPEAEATDAEVYLPPESYSISALPTWTLALTSCHSLPACCLLITRSTPSLSARRPTMSRPRISRSCSRARRRSRCPCLRK